MPAIRLYATTALFYGTSTLALLSGGCGPSNLPQPRQIHVVPLDPLTELRNLLETCAEQGWPEPIHPAWPSKLSKLVEEVGKTDADKAALLKSGIAEMVETPSTASTKARKLLKQLGP
jgi:hypothetical protein